MWATSAAFDEALHATSRRWHTRVEVLYGGDFVVALNMVTDGKVSLDDVAVRRSVSLAMIDVDGTLTPSDARDLLAPKGTELRIERGLTLATGAIEWVPLGVFGIDRPRVAAHKGGTILTVDALDRVAAVRTRRFVTPWVVTAGTSTAQAISDIVTSRLDVPTRITQTGHTTPEVAYEELSDPWAAVEALAAADGLVAFFDALGTLVVAPDVPVTTGAVYAKAADGLLLSTERGMRADVTYSGVIVKGEHPDLPPVRVELWDTDPASSTYHLGPFGQRPFGFTSPLIKDATMANAAAATILPKVTGMRQEIALETIGTPGHDIGDVVQVNDPTSRTQGEYLVIGASIPLRSGQVGLKLRSLE